jgi:hypothetical protein
MPNDRADWALIRRCVPLLGTFIPSDMHEHNKSVELGSFVRSPGKLSDGLYGSSCSDLSR